MKQEEKTQKTKQRILDAAIAEFGSKSYDAASVNSICEAGHISKGLLYHNFSGKDELYLQCVQCCYDEMTAFLKAQPLKIQNVKESLETVLMLRQRFFSENPCYANIFFNAILQPPAHLTHKLAQLRSGFEEYFSQCYREMLGRLTLRKGITPAMALEYFSAVWEMFNGYFQKKAMQSGDYRALIEAHENKLSGIFDIMLYGIAEQPQEEPHGTGRESPHI